MKDWFHIYIPATVYPINIFNFCFGLFCFGHITGISGLGNSPVFFTDSGVNIIPITRPKIYHGISRDWLHTVLHKFQFWTLNFTGLRGIQSRVLWRKTIARYQELTYLFRSVMIITWILIGCQQGYLQSHVLKLLPRDCMISWWRHQIHFCFAHTESVTILYSNSSSVFNF